MPSATGNHGGITVYGWSTPPIVGHKYFLSGAIQEYYGETEFSNPVYVVDQGAVTLPAPLAVTVATSKLEACGSTSPNGELFESMLVKLTNVKSVIRRDYHGMRLPNGFYVAGQSPSYADTVFVFNYDSALGAADTNNVNYPAGGVSVDIVGDLHYGMPWYPSGSWYVNTGNTGYYICPRSGADITIRDDVAPGTITDLAVTMGRRSAKLTWTAPGDDGYTGTATAYDLRYSRSPINLGNFLSATQVQTAGPGTAGTSECVSTGTVLTSCAAYYFAVKTRDEAGNWSALSDVPSGNTACQGWSEPICEGGLSARPADPSEQVDVPRVAALYARGANPVASRAELGYDVPADRDGAPLQLAVYDLAGRRVRQLASGPARAGRYGVAWDRRAGDGSPARAGVYFVRMTLGGLVLKKSLILVD